MVELTQPASGAPAGSPGSALAGGVLVASNLPSEVRAFLIADVRGYTRFTQEQGGQAAAQLTIKFAAIAGACIGAHKGRVMGQRGDEVVAVFNSARAALRAALELQTRCIEQTQADLTLPLRVGVGVAAGEVVKVGDDYRGAAINLAARLCSLAVSGEVLASKDAARRARKTPGLTYVERGSAHLKGFEAPVPVVRVVPEGAPASSHAHEAPAAVPAPWLPQPLTAMLGREDDANRALDQLRRPDVRLLTVTGPGGVGKTRLGLHVAHSLGTDFPDGVFFVELAAVREPELVLPAVAHRLGVQLGGGQSVAEQLVALARDKRMLWVLDNFEQVLDGARHVVQVLAACPQLKVLATSRAPLRLRGERELSLLPLALPEPERVTSAAEALCYPAVLLFAERARAVKQDFALADEDVAAVIGICRRLDGLPLAIELAAARIKVLPLRSLHKHLGEAALKLTAGGARDLPERHQTLRAAIDWSYTLLSEPEQALFRRLAVFHGGCGFEAVEAVCAEDGDEERIIDPFTDLEALVEHSLLLQREARGEPRYLLLETIREYAQELLRASAEAEALHRRHARYYLDLAERAEPQLTGPQQREWLHLLEREHGNLRAALRWTSAHDLEAALRLAGALDRFWDVRGHYTEGRHWLKGLLEKAQHAADTTLVPGVFARALYAAALLAYDQQDYAEATHLLERCLELRHADQDKRGVADALNVYGLVARDQGQREQAKRFFSQCADLRREIGDQRGLSMALLNLGNVALAHNNGEAASFFEESLQLSRTLGDSAAVALALNNWGNVERELGELKRAELHFEESLDIYRELGGQRGIAMVLNNMGNVAYILGDYERAQALLEEALTIRISLHDRRGAILALNNLGNVARDRGDSERAVWLFEESLATSHQIRDEEAEAFTLTFLGKALLDLNTERAATTLDRALALHTNLRNPEGIALCQSFHGCLACRHEQYAEAAILYLETCRQFQKLNEPLYAAECVEGLAKVASAQDKHQCAARLYGAAAVIRDSLHAPLPPTDRPDYDRHLSSTRQALGEVAFTKVWAEGQAMSLDEVLASVR
jgi:predicted ATPase/class 3 adenylate cyclase/Tfp pilus assembly protein PilF